METVFDYNITDEEREYLGLSYAKNVEEYAPVDEETANMALASLFWYRGDRKKAAKYADKLPPLAKLDFYRTVTHP